MRILVMNQARRTLAKGEKRNARQEELEKARRRPRRRRDRMARRKLLDHERATVLSSEVVYQGPLFRVLHDKLIEPEGARNEREMIRHNGSVVILAHGQLEEQEKSVDCDGTAIPARGQPVSVGAAGRQAGPRARSRWRERNASWPKRPATGRRHGGRWSSTTPAPAFWANR